MKRYPWVKYLKRSQPELPYDSPIYLGNWTNGEFFHEQTPHERRVREEILRVGAEKARRLNIDRREFMASAMGMVTTLSVIQACSAPTSQSAGGARSVPTIPSQGGTPGSSGQGAMLPGQASVGQPTAQHGGPGGMPGSSGGMSGGPGMGAAGQPSGGANAHVVGTDPGAPGQYCFDKDSGVDPTMCDQAAREILKPASFIFDAQTHCFEDDPNATWRKSPPPGFNDSLSSLLFGKCSSDPVMCVGPDDYVRLMFLQSDTTMTVLSAWPYGQGPSDPNSNVFLAKTRDWINKDLAASSRVVNHASVVPWIGVSGMDMAAQMLRVAGWKLYPAAPGNLYKMDDKTGRAFIERGIKLGVKTFSIHKGLPISGFSEPHNLPDDIGPVAKDYPDCNFVVYHSAICAGQTGMGFTCTPMEGPYVMGSKVNSDALITSLLDNGIKPNSNVFAEMGGAFSQLMSNPTAAGQWLGKLVQYVGDRNVVWGTDSILTGTSPQGQIQAFMGLQHPMLTPQVKQQILGTNLARLYCVDPMEKRCQVDKSKVALLKREQDAEFGDYRWVLLGHQRTLGPTTRREFMGMVRWEDSKHRPG